MKFPPLKWVRTNRLEGVPCPWYVGYAYKDFDRNWTVYWVVPINLIIAAYLWIILQVRFGFVGGLEMKVARAIELERRRCLRIIDKYKDFCADPESHDAFNDVIEEIEDGT